MQENDELHAHSEVNRTPVGGGMKWARSYNPFPDKICNKNINRNSWPVKALEEVYRFIHTRMPFHHFLDPGYALWSAGYDNVCRLSDATLYWHRLPRISLNKSSVLTKNMWHNASLHLHNLNICTI